MAIVEALRGMVTPAAPDYPIVSGNDRFNNESDWRRLGHSPRPPPSASG